MKGAARFVAGAVLGARRGGRLARWGTRLLALGMLVRDLRTPRKAKLVAAGVIAYALSPVDLIPDFVPLFGLLDDLVVVPLGIALVVHLLPDGLWTDVVRRAEINAAAHPRRLRWLIAALILAAVLWVATLVWIGAWIVGGLAAGWR